MRKIFALFLLIGIFIALTTSPVAAQTPSPPSKVATPVPTAAAAVSPIPALTPTPNPIDQCFEKGAIACLPAVTREWGWVGIGILGVVFLASYLIVAPLGKILQEKIQEWFKSRPFLRPASVPPIEFERHEAEAKYLLVLEQSHLLQLPEETTAQLDAYLAKLLDRENLLRPSEEKVFVSLEGGLDISQRIGLSTPIDSGQARMFTEQKTFENIADALNAIDEATQAPYAVLALLGEPGAGKSTLMRKFVRDYVRKRIEDPSALLPIFTSLSSYKNGTPLTFLREEWKRMLGFDGLDEALAAGRVWLFIDGLNEMPRKGYDTRVAQWRAFLREYVAPHGNRALVACRVADYGEGISAPRLLIHAMDDEHIHNFLRKRIPDRAEMLWHELEHDMKEERGAIYELAQIPFWLVMLTRLSGKTGLPRNRASLLDEFIKTWLDYENSRPAGRFLNDILRQAFMDGLTALAWAGLTRSQNYTFRLKDACKILNDKQSVVSADNLLGLAQDCSLLTIEGDGLRFQHQLLQEFFAARELARRFTAGKYLRAKWRTPWRRWRFVKSKWDPLPSPPLTGWEEAVILGAGMLNAKQAETLTLVILKDTPVLATRCSVESGAPMSPETINKIRARLLQDLQSPRLRLPARLEAGKALAKMGDPRLLRQTREIKDAASKIFQFIEPDWVDVPEGVFRMGTNPQESLILTISKLKPSPDELPAHDVFISAFKMARYPVTVAEYRCFVDAGGYNNDSYWLNEKGLRWRNAPLPFEESYAAIYIKMLRENQKQLLMDIDGWVKQGAWSPAQAENARRQMQMNDEAIRTQWDDFEAQKRNPDGQVFRPYLWDETSFTLSNQPVVGVTWYEACAYAAWLTEMLHTQKLLDRTMHARLPTEAEWEKIARGGKFGLWAWGSLWNDNRANTLEGRVMKPSPVGAYPGGASRFGVQDMPGNVWEWCSDWYAQGTYPQRAGQQVKNPVGPEQGSRRVLRGGSWSYDRDGARCAYRYSDVPDDFYDDLGFRLVCSPSSPLNSKTLSSESLNPFPA